VTTIFQAEMAGTVAAMSTDAKREIPAEFAQRTATREAWENAFDKMRQELRGTPVEAPKGMRLKAEASEGKKTRKPKEPAQEAPEVVEPVKHRKMDDIFLELHPEAREYA
jgi:hypothetical protein